MNAHDEILRRCRANGLGWVMRQFGDPERCYVISLHEREPIPGLTERTGERRDKRIAEGASWEEVLTILESHEKG